VRQVRCIRGRVLERRNKRVIREKTVGWSVLVVNGPLSGDAMNWLFPNELEEAMTKYIAIFATLITRQIYIFSC
jgi:hypothetical protein